MNETPPAQNQDRRFTLFIEKDENTIYLPSPSSWFGGLGRQTCVEKATGRATLILSSNRWEEFQKTHPVRKLWISSNGECEIEDLV
jgi:hypothetical protein